MDSIIVVNVVMPEKPLSQGTDFRRNEKDIHLSHTLWG